MLVSRFLSPPHALEIKKCACGCRSDIKNLKCHKHKIVFGFHWEFLLNSQCGTSKHFLKKYFIMIIILCVRMCKWLQTPEENVKFHGTEVQLVKCHLTRVLQTKLQSSERLLNHLPGSPNNFCIAYIQEKFQQHRMLNYCLDPDTLILILFSTCLCFQTVWIP